MNYLFIVILVIVYCIYKLTVPRDKSNKSWLYADDCKDPNHVKNADGKCVCKSGWKWDSSAKKCVDKDSDCKDPNHVKNAEGKCVCKSGWNWDGDKCQNWASTGCKDPNHVKNAEGKCVCQFNYEWNGDKCVRK